MKLIEQTDEDTDREVCDSTWPGNDREMLDLPTSSRVLRARDRFTPCGNCGSHSATGVRKIRSCPLKDEIDSDLGLCASTLPFVATRGFASVDGGRLILRRRRAFLVPIPGRQPAERSD